MSVVTSRAKRRQARLRWRIADLINLLPWTCWPRIVTWALDGRTVHGDGPGLFSSTGKSCRAESRVHRDCACYCGKFRDKARWTEAEAES